LRNILTGLDRAHVDLGRAFRQHVLGRGHLADQRKQSRNSANACGTDGRNVDEVAAADAFSAQFGQRIRICGASRISHQSCLACRRRKRGSRQRSR